MPYDKKYGYLDGPDGWYTGTVQDDGSIQPGSYQGLRESIEDYREGKVHPKALIGFLNDPKEREEFMALLDSITNEKDKKILEGLLKRKTQLETKIMGEVEKTYLKDGDFHGPASIYPGSNKK